MKHRLFLFAVLLAALTMPNVAKAYDFSAVAPTGQTLYYNIVGGNAQVISENTSGSYSTYPTGALTIPSSVTYQGTTYAVTKIGVFAFAGCSDLTSIIIPSSVTHIGWGAFYECTGITSVTIPSSVTVIEEEAFLDCTSLTTVTIPDGVTYIGSRAFWRVRHIEYHGSATGSPWDANSMNGVTEGDFVYSDSTKNHLLAYIGAGGSVTIPSSVIAIWNNAFQYCRDLISITIPNSVRAIDDDAFEGCTGLTSITIPNSVTYIGSGLFYNCTGLTSITLPNSVTSIPSELFANCSGLTSFTFPNSVTSIGGYAFYGCTGLTSISLPNSLTTIEDATFYGCTGLTSITLPNSLTTIEVATFYGCEGLTSVTLPKSVSSIGHGAFYNCTGLTEIYSLAIEPPTLGIEVFNNVSAGIPIYVPCGAVDAYQSDTGWNIFTNYHRVFPYSVGIGEHLHGSVNIVQATCNNPEATITAIADEGYTFDRWSDGNTDNPRTLIVTSDTTMGALFTAVAYYTVTVSNALGSGTYTHGSTAVLAALPQVGLQFAGWSDGETANPRSITVTSDITLDALFTAPDTIRIYDTVTVFDTVINIVYDTTEYNHYYYDSTVITHYIFDSTWVFDTIYIFDTVYIRDTVVVGMDKVETVQAKVYVSQGQIVIEGAEGHTVTLYDLNGRVLATKQDNDMLLHFDAPATGTYMIKIGNYPARKVVVIR